MLLGEWVSYGLWYVVYRISYIVYRNRNVGTHSGHMSYVWLLIVSGVSNSEIGNDVL